MSALTPVNPNWSSSNSKGKDPKQSSTGANDSLDSARLAQLYGFPTSKVTTSQYADNLGLLRGRQRARRPRIRLRIKPSKGPRARNFCEETPQANPIEDGYSDHNRAWFSVPQDHLVPESTTVDEDEGSPKCNAEALSTPPDSGSDKSSTIDCEGDEKEVSVDRQLQHRPSENIAAGSDSELRASGAKRLQRRHRRPDRDSQALAFRKYDPTYGQSLSFPACYHFPKPEAEVDGVESAPDALVFDASEHRSVRDNTEPDFRPMPARVEPEAPLLADSEHSTIMEDDDSDTIAVEPVSPKGVSIENCSTTEAQRRPHPHAVHFSSDGLVESHPTKSILDLRFRRMTRGTAHAYLARAIPYLLPPNLPGELVSAMTAE